MYGIEKRQQERYPLHVPINIMSFDNQVHFMRETLTEDISSKGVFVRTTDQVLQEGRKVRMELTLTIDKLKELFGCSEKIILKVDGSIIRSMNEGLAIEFDKQYLMVPEILRTS